MKEIVQDGAPVLREATKPVPEWMFGTSELARIIEDMENALDPHPEGVALAAPQIGVSYRIFIVRMDRALPPPLVAAGAAAPEPAPQNDVYINPEIVKTSKKRARVDEGCLSVHGVFGTTLRHERASVRARRADGTRFERGGSGILAQIFEHEVDHLNGILFTDHAENMVEIKPEHERE